MSYRSALGRRGEDAAVEYLQSLGMVVLDRNWRGRQGEIDVVARDGQTIVFCEVKTRSGLLFGDPLESITDLKAARLRRLAGEWLATVDSPCPRARIDAVGIIWQRGRAQQVRHVRGIAS